MKIAKKILVAVLTLAVLASCLALFAYAEEPHFDYSAPYAEGTYSSILEYYEQNIDVDFDIDGVEAGADYPDPDALFVQMNGKTIKVNEADGNKYVSITAPGTKGYNAFIKWTADNDLNGVKLNFDISAMQEENPANVVLECSERVKGHNRKDVTLTLDEFLAKYTQYADATPAVGDEVGACDYCTRNGTLTVKSISAATFKRPIAHVMLSSVVETDAAEANTTGFDFLVLDSEADELRYGTVVDGEFTYVTVENSVFDYDPTAWYTVELEYNAGSKTYDLTLNKKGDSENKLVLENIPADLDSVRTVKFGIFSNRSENYDVSVLLDNVTARGGSFDRNNADKQRISDEYVTYFGSDFDLVDTDTKEKIIDVYSRMTVGGYVAESAEAVSASTKLAMYVLPALESYVASFDEADKYADRLIAYTSLTTYIGALPDENNFDRFSEADAERFAAVKTACDSEIAELTLIKADSLDVAATLKYFDLNSQDYAYLNPFYEYVKDKRFDSTVPGAADAEKAFNSLTNVFAELKKKAETFVEKVFACDPADQTAFGVNYILFAEAKANFSSNPTYPGIADNGSEEGALSVYLALAEHYEPYEQLNNAYKDQVYRAEIGTYINSVKLSLAGAYAIIHIGVDEDNGPVYHEYFRADFPGIAESMETYERLKKSVEDKEAAAEAYIKAVEALKELEGEALVNGIKAAEELQKNGNVSGIAGVELANIYLDTLKTEFSLTNGYYNKFISLVGSLENAKTLGQRYAIIEEALSIDSKYLVEDSAILAAEAKLDAAIAAYNAEVAKLNATLLGTAVQ